MTTKITIDEIIPEMMHGVIINKQVIIPACIESIAFVRKKEVDEETGENKVVFYARKAFSISDDLDEEDYFAISEFETLFKIEGKIQTIQELKEKLNHQFNIPYLCSKHCIIDMPIQFFTSKKINGYEFTLFDVDEFAQYVESLLNK